MMYLKYIAGLPDEAVGLSVKNVIPPVDDSCRVDKFVVEVSLNKKALFFWDDGYKEGKTIVIPGKARILSVWAPGRIRIIDIIDQNFPNIEVIVWGDCVYPRFGFRWIGWNQTDRIKKGALAHARVELDEDLYLTYYKKNTGKGYMIINPTGIYLPSYKLPTRLEAVRKISGIHFSRKIKFDAKTKEIIRTSNLEKYLDELRLSAESK